MPRVSVYFDATVRVVVEATSDADAVELAKEKLVGEEVAVRDIPIGTSGEITLYVSRDADIEAILPEDEG